MEVEERLPLCQYRYFVLYYALYYKYDEETLNSFISSSYLRYKKEPDLNLLLLFEQTLFFRSYILQTNHLI